MDKKLSPTVHIENLINRSRVAPIEIFCDYPFDTIRTICVEMMEKSGLNGYGPKIVEDFITKLMGSENVFDQTDYAERVLSAYLIRCEDDNRIIRAVEFAISIRKLFFDRSKISKFVIGKIDRNIDLYYKIPSLKSFLTELLSEMIDHGKQSGYSSADWYEAERAQRLILDANDFSFLWKMEQILAHLKRGLINPGYGTPEMKDLHIARIEITKKYLLAAEEKATE